MSHANDNEKGRPYILATETIVVRPAQTLIVREKVQTYDWRTGRWIDEPSEDENQT